MGLFLFGVGKQGVQLRAAVVVCSRINLDGTAKTFDRGLRIAALFVGFAQAIVHIEGLWILFRVQFQNGDSVGRVSFT